MTKTTDKWWPRYPADWDRDTGHLTNEENGAYVRLVDWYWINGPIPDDDKVLGAIVRDPRGWKSRLRQVLVAFFQRSDGFWYHKRVEAELAKARELSATRHEIAKAGAAKRWGKSSAKVVPFERDRE